jgi:CheY-like chemotaxis protein
VADVERGSRNPSLASIAKLARALKVSLSELFSTRMGTRSSVIRRPSTNGGANGGWNGHLAEILLVEDNGADAELAVRALKKCNLHNRIHLVRDGYEALDFIFRAGIYARRPVIKGSLVILLDLNLPGLDGLEVLRRIKSDSRSRTIPVVILTVSQRSKDIAESRRLGADDYIVKPVDFEQFGPTMPRVGFHWVLLERPPT